MFKKLTGILAAMTLIISLAACGQANQASESSSLVTSAAAMTESRQAVQAETSQAKSATPDASGSKTAVTEAAGTKAESSQASAESSATEAVKASSAEAATEAAGTKAESSQPSAESSATEAATEPAATGRTLVVYFSWSPDGNTEKMASYIQSQTGADILRLQPSVPYPSDYGETAELAKTERDENARPQIANLPASIAEYDKIYLGYPIWWHTAPMIIGSFLNNYDFSGVDIYPFTQSASMDAEQFNNSMGFVRSNARGANVHDGLFVQASDTAGILQYLNAAR